MKSHYFSLKTQYLPLVLLVVLAGCGGKNKKTKADTKKGKKHEMFTQVDIPTAGNESDFLFNDMTNEFDIADNIESEADILKSFDFLEEDVLNSETFKVVHFDFDKSSIRADQEPIVQRDIQVAKALLDEDANAEVTIVIDGHSCSSAGSRTYNLALSEQRAKTLRDRFVAEGIPAENLKIVARGSEVPAVVDGAPVTGDRTAQAPNRRDEVRVIYS
jgi:outer membrane protein OmpA-like peptidoglycan-associated protein